MRTWNVRTRYQAEKSKNEKKVDILEISEVRYREKEIINILEAYAVIFDNRYMTGPFGLKEING